MTHVVVGAVVPVVTRGDLNHDRRAAVMTAVMMWVAALHVGHGATVAVTAIAVVVRGAVVPVRCVGAAPSDCFFFLAMAPVTHTYPHRHVHMLPAPARSPVFSLAFSPVWLDVVG